MPNQILLDNWTLQEITHLSNSGLPIMDTGKLIVDHKNDTHSFKKITLGSIQIEALFGFLQNLVLRDTIVTDNRFTHVWNGNDLLHKLKTDDILKIHAFKEEKFMEVRKAIVMQLCATSTIREIQRLNEIEWEENQRSYDSFMSQIIWGGAGMLARGHVYETFYSPHPLRGYAFKQSPIAKRDAFTETLSFISTNQTKLLYFDYGSSEAIQAKFLLPPLIPTIVEESNDFDDLFRVALQLRDQFQDLRAWLKQFQEAIDNEDTKEVSKHIKVLESIQKNIENKYNPDKFGSLDLGFDFFSLSPSISIPLPVNRFRNSIGIRSTINELILTKAGYSSIKKLLKLLGEENSKLGKQVYDEVVINYST